MESKIGTAVCRAARTVVWEVGGCESRRQLPFMISIYLLPDWSKGGFTVWATVKTVAQTVFSVAQSVIAVAHSACSDAPKPLSITHRPLIFPKLFFGKTGDDRKRVRTTSSAPCLSAKGKVGRGPCSRAAFGQTTGPALRGRYGTSGHGLPGSGYGHVVSLFLQ